MKKKEEKKEVKQTLLERIDSFKRQLSNMNGQLDEIGKEALEVKVKELPTKVVLEVIEESNKQVQIEYDGHENYQHYSRSGAEMLYDVIKHKLKKAAEEEDKWK